MNRYARVVLITVLVVVAAAVAAATAVSWLDSSPGKSALFTVESGDTVSSVARTLQEKGVIRNRYFFRLVSRWQGTEGSIRRGMYSIEAGMTTMEIHDLLIEGKQRLYRVTIPEGLTSRGVAAVLEAEGIVEGNAFLEAVNQFNPFASDADFDENRGAEGFLYPDTYLFQKDFPADKVVEHLVDSFFEVLEKVEPDYRDLSSRELYETVILSSIIEREYRRKEEAPLISSVFRNRLETGMPLQSCATVVYVLTEELGRPHPERITFRDLEAESFFNTYQNTGLPPAPICNPGLIAIDAAFNPEESDYLFFILINPETGEHLFTRNYGDHDRAYQLYIKER